MVCHCQLKGMYTTWYQRLPLRKTYAKCMLDGQPICRHCVGLDICGWHLPTDFAGILKNKQQDSRFTIVNWRTCRLLDVRGYPGQELKPACQMYVGWAAYMKTFLNSGLQPCAWHGPTNARNPKNKNRFHYLPLSIEGIMVHHCQLKNMFITWNQKLPQRKTFKSTVRHWMVDKTCDKASEDQNVVMFSWVHNVIPKAFVWM